MTARAIAHPTIVSRDEWLVARKALLAREKELTRQYDAVNAARRRLPMVRVDKQYIFDGPGGKVSLHDLFGGARQLIIYSAYARGVEGLTHAYSLLDRTAYGRQEDFEDSPAGWPQRPTHG